MDRLRPARPRHRRAPIRRGLACAARAIGRVSRSTRAARVPFPPSGPPARNQGSSATTAFSAVGWPSSARAATGQRRRFRSVLERSSHTTSTCREDANGIRVCCIGIRIRLRVGRGGDPVGTDRAPIGTSRDSVRTRCVRDSPSSEASVRLAKRQYVMCTWGYATRSDGSARAAARAGRVSPLPAQARAGSRRPPAHPSLSG
jgi:hypothetical protein